MNRLNYKAILKELMLENDRLMSESYRSRAVSIDFLPRKATVLIGVRRSGKSTQLILNGQFHSDFKVMLDFSDERLDGFKLEHFNEIQEAAYEVFPIQENSTVYWYFDEIQDIDGWEKYINRMIKNVNYHIGITGSSAKMLSKEISTVMRGRALTYEVYPLSFAEFLDFHKVSVGYSHAEKAEVKRYFQEYLVYGGFPELVAVDETHKKKILSSYFETIFYRDIIERYEVKNTVAAKSLALLFLSHYSTRTSGNKIYEKLKAQGFSIGKDFVFELIQAYEDCYFIFQISLFSKSQHKKNLSLKKIYAIDTGLVSALLFSKNNFGELLENLVFIELKRRGYEIFYYVTQSGYEVDFYAQKEGTVQLIQVCWDLSDSETLEREERALLEAHKEHPQAESLIVTGESSSHPLAKPFWAWALEG